MLDNISVSNSSINSSTICPAVSLSAYSHNTLLKPASVALEHIRPLLPFYFLFHPKEANHSISASIIRGAIDGCLLVLSIKKVGEYLAPWFANRATYSNPHIQHPRVELSHPIQPRAHSLETTQKRALPALHITELQVRALERSTSRFFARPRFQPHDFDLDQLTRVPSKRGFRWIMSNLGTICNFLLTSGPTKVSWKSICAQLGTNKNNIKYLFQFIIQNNSGDILGLVHPNGQILNFFLLLENNGYTRENILTIIRKLKLISLQLKRPTE